MLRNDVTIAAAWLNRAERLLAGVPRNASHGWLAINRSFFHALAGNSRASLDAASDALDIGHELADPDLTAMGMATKGQALIALGDVEAGLALVDEASVSAVGGELDPQTAGGVSCTGIEACAMLGGVEPRCRVDRGTGPLVPSRGDRRLSRDVPTLSVRDEAAAGVVA